MEKEIFCLLALKQYFRNCYYPLELVMIIMYYYDDDEWIEHYFNEYQISRDKEVGDKMIFKKFLGDLKCRRFCMCEWFEYVFTGFPTFGKKSYIPIQKIGLGIDKIIFKIVLPKLPNDLKYKKFCVYDLINNITIEIGGSPILTLGSRHLEIFDRIERNFKIIRNHHTVIDNHVVSYLLDLSYFFKESSTNSEYPEHLIPMNFKGIRLIDMTYHDVYVYVTFNDIYHLIDANDDIININRDILCKLDFEDATINCHYVKPYQEEQMYQPTVTQPIRMMSAHEHILSAMDSYCKVELCDRLRGASQIIFHSEISHKNFKNILLLIDGNEYTNQINLLNDNTFVMHVNIPSHLWCIQLCLQLYDRCDNFKISYICSGINYGIYASGMFGLQHSHKYDLCA